MLTFLNRADFDKYLIKDFITIEQDQNLCWLNTKDGFITEGVSAGIVLVIYHHTGLAACSHWGAIPASDAPAWTTEQFVNNHLCELKGELLKKDQDLSHFTVYAIGGQDSSQNLIDALKKAKNSGDFNFKLNTNNLHLKDKVSDDELFDLIMPKGLPLFPACKEEPSPYYLSEQKALTVLRELQTVTPFPKINTKKSSNTSHNRRVAKKR